MYTTAQLKSLEEQAVEFGKDPKQVERRLRSATRLLLPNYRKQFDKDCVYDASRRMLYSIDQKLALVWLLRRKPDQPIGYQNQQTIDGVVYCIECGIWEMSPNL